MIDDMNEKRSVEPPKTIAQVADWYQVSHRTVQRWIKGGLCRAIRVGRNVRILEVSEQAGVNNDTRKPVSGMSQADGI